jgi:hypothetical protein
MCACRRVQAAPIPDEILHEIWTQNKGFWQDMHMFDDDYIRFLWQFLQTKDAEMGMLPRTVGPAWPSAKAWCYLYKATGSECMLLHGFCL